MEENFKNSIAEFDNYIKQFDMSDPMISRKYHHTFRVVNYAKEIGISENLNDQNQYILFLCALLHDIARFTQATDYHTFNDLLSFDHGDKGYEILLQDNFISRFTTDKNIQKIVLKAIKNHNKFSVDSTLNDQELFFANLVRDADKIDILDKLLNELNDENYTIELEAITAFFSHKLYKSSTNPTNATKLVRSLCFIYDINFNKTFELILEKKIIERKIEVLKKHFDNTFVDSLYDEAMNFINSKLNISK